MNKSVLNKILITLAFLFAYRMLSYVPIPGIDGLEIKRFFDANASNALGLFNMFSGNAVERVSIISLGIMPYITASIIMELLSATFANIGKMKKERDGMQQYMQIIRYLTIAITIVQSASVAYGLRSIGNGGAIVINNMSLFVTLAVFSMLTGTMLLMWIGEQITQKGVGNGISLIIFAGIVSGIPSAIGSEFSAVSNGDKNIFQLLIVFAVIIATVFVIIYIELAERRVPISYARKVIMQNQNKRIMNYIPIKINLSGVIPPIFASALLVFPSTILQQASPDSIWATIGDYINPNGYLYNIIMFLFIIFFAYFYSSIVFNAKDIADNLKRQNGYIPGLRPGENTANYLNKVAGHLTFWGSLYLAIISTLPWLLLKGIGVHFIFGGTSVLIVVQVAIDTMRKIEAQLYTSKYKTLSAVGL
ncbi:preprotein translocase subunit SecY [Helicobacter saguini]|uniref:Protein translocase subunit SecY n=1 Tax=Helicobacter saguini TaxID=1548018 RepID=A0A347VR60_9HELI|nr:preprotein translocase subunit SecY [Helicobacter saguini]MWV63023.1 preprotein translocase subunit SecY [Helicobacter saguini]MWV66308.1 preprotein translocase subunit SecY [Helicobacter saguini]MWV68660.1 preprotein translocase subunit SecY [Helicobacter saguini]MWV71789.1 preprotein translocase subunit SecY [Helicobacter saguini]TLD95817.1 preprotein translocase subunit SecY [Helicobacter saguini]